MPACARRGLVIHLRNRGEIGMRRLSLVLIGCLTVACVRTRTDPVTGRVDVDVESPTKKGEDWKASVTGQGAFSAVRGSATASVLQGQSTIVVVLEGATAGGNHPWRVHEGKCAGTPGADFGPASAYQPLVIGSDGKGQATARVSMALDEAKDYHVRVHASASDMATTVACGDLSDSA
jgi:hypothetical protein